MILPYNLGSWPQNSPKIAKKPDHSIAILPYIFWILLSKGFRICVAKGGIESLGPSWGRPKLTLISNIAEVGIFLLSQLHSHFFAKWLCILAIFHILWDGVWKIAKMQSHLAKSGCGTDYIIGHFFQKIWIFFLGVPWKFHGVCVPHLFPDNSIYLGSHRRIMGQKPNEIFSSESQTQNIKEFCKACGTLVHIRYGSNLKNLIFTFVPKIFPDIYMYIGSPKKFLAKNPIKIFSPWHRNLSSPLTWDFWKVAKMRHLGLPWKFFYGAFVPHLFPDIYIYLGSHRWIMGQNPMKIFDQIFFRKKTFSLNPVTPSLLHTVGGVEDWRWRLVGGE